MAARLPQWLAEEGLTLGIGTPVVIGQVAALVAKWVSKIKNFIRGLLDSLRRLQRMVEKLGEILTDLKNKLARTLESDPFEKADEPELSGTGSGSGWHPGDPIPPPRDGDELPTDASLPASFHGENDPTNPNRAFYPDTVHYMTPEEREGYRVFVDADGSLRSAQDGSLYDTSAATGSWSTGGRAIFVMDGSGNLYATLERRVGHTHHSSLLAGQPVVGAGEIEVSNGTLVAMTDQSGHYQPMTTMNDRVLQSLRDQGVVTDPGFKQYGWGDDER